MSVRNLIISGLIALGALSPQLSQAQIKWPDLSTSCLPVDGKMKPVRNWNTKADINPVPACHCPPASMCPTTAAEWDNQTRIPMGVAHTCCQEPVKKCDVMHHYVSRTSCQAYFVSPPESYQFCSTYKAQNAENSELFDKRKAVANRLNVCIKNSKCNEIMTGVETNIKTSADMQRYLVCYNTCAQEAAVSLGVPYSQYPISIINEIGTISKMEPQDYSAYPAYTPLFAKRHLDFVAHMYSRGGTPSGLWGEQLAKQFAESYPKPRFDPDQVFKGHLACDMTQSLNVCFAGSFPASSCIDCLAAGTQVELADGSFKDIEKITPGDRVRGQNGVNTVVELVALEWDSMVMHKVNDGLLTLTADHPVMTKAGWKALRYDSAFEKYGLKDVAQLEIGDTLIMRDKEVTITSLEEQPLARQLKTYNLKMQGDGTFYANGVIVKDLAPQD